jgi:hypothetical protein
MSLLDAPVYDEKKENLTRNIVIGSAALFFLLVVLTIAGFFAGHGWLFTNLGYEHRVNNFFNALEAKDYAKAYGLYNADPDWQQHPQKYTGYPLDKFTRSKGLSPRTTLIFRSPTAAVPSAPASSLP